MQLTIVEEDNAVFFMGRWSPMRELIVDVIFQHANDLELRERWGNAFGDACLVDYARKHWDELVPLIVKERLCS